MWPRAGRHFGVASGDVEVEFHEGTRIFERLKTRLVGVDGSEVEITAEPALGYWSMDGASYDWGWSDGKGLGFNRGDYYTENDVFDISHPEDFVHADGSVHTPMHREAPCQIIVEGEHSDRSCEHQVFAAAGPVKWLGIEG